MIIDAHVHLTSEAWRQGPQAFEFMITSARKTGIDKICLFPSGYMTKQDMIGANDLVLRVMDLYPNEVIGFCYVNPMNTQEALKELERCLVRNSMYGLKLGIQCETTNPLMDPVMEFIDQVGVPILQHAWDKVTGNYEFESTPYEVAQLAKGYPNVNIIMAHLYGARFKGILDVAPYKNIYVDVSGGNPEAGVLEYGVEVLGAERIVFGSDAPGRDFSVQLSKVLGADLSPDIKERILSENMLALLRRD